MTDVLEDVEIVVLNEEETDEPCIVHPDATATHTVHCLVCSQHYGLCAPCAGELEYAIRVYGDDSFTCKVLGLEDTLRNMLKIVPRCNK